MDPDILVGINGELKFSALTYLFHHPLTFTGGNKHNHFTLNKLIETMEDIESTTSFNQVTTKKLAEWSKAVDNAIQENFAAYWVKDAITHLALSKLMIVTNHEEQIPALDPYKKAKATLSSLNEYRADLGISIQNMEAKITNLEKELLKDEAEIKKLKAEITECDQAFNRLKEESPPDEQGIPGRWFKAGSTSSYVIGLVSAFGLILIKHV